MKWYLMQCSATMPDRNPTMQQTQTPTVDVKIKIEEKSDTPDAIQNRYAESDGKMCNRNRGSVVWGRAVEVEGRWHGVRELYTRRRGELSERPTDGFIPVGRARPVSCPDFGSNFVAAGRCVSMEL